ncbi:MAG: hypothetical protein U9Q73_03020 [Nanoarchaeota archaeon]|nr:hypothetical protein [Nanoarchaeota archaeon]
MKERLKELVRELWVPVVVGATVGIIAGTGIGNKQRFPIRYEGTVRLIEGSTERKKVIDLTPRSESYGKEIESIKAEYECEIEKHYSK